MCKLIAQLVGTDKQIVRELVHRLEHRSGQPGVDIRLSGEIFGAAHIKARALGLDPHDTTARELYQALLNTTKLHDGFMMRYFGLKSDASNVEIVERVALVLSKLHLHKTVWTIRSSTAKKILHANHPKNLQKLLGYRSQESMFKREQALLLLAASQYTEPSSWRQKYHAQLKKMTPMDFEPRQLSIDALTSKHWQRAARAMVSHTSADVLHNELTGNILVLPIRGAVRNGLALFTAASVLHFVNELKSKSSFLKYHQMQPDFGKLLVNVLKHDHAQHIPVVGQDVHWRSLHRLFGKQSGNHPEVFHPHVQAEDIAYRRAEDVLFKLEPALHFWHNMDYVGWPTPAGPVSFNLLDNLVNLVNNLSFEDRVSYHLAPAVWDELYARYMGQASLQHHLFDELESRLVSDPMLAEMEFVL